MISRIFLLVILQISTIYGYDSGSAETNKIDNSPIYDTIIFGDVADIFNELGNGLSPMGSYHDSTSDSEENLEDLLLEYQNSVDKAFNQHLKYLEKTKTKNKVPPVRHDRFAKMKSAGGMKSDDYYYTGGSFINPKYILPKIDRPIDIYMPMSQNSKIGSKNSQMSFVPKEGYQDTTPEIVGGISTHRFEPNSCVCKSKDLPCDCKCKQCFIYDAAAQKYYQYPKKELYQPGELSEDKLNDPNTLNIKIKVDIQLPKIKELSARYPKNRSFDELNSKESTVSVPFPDFNFPIPMDMFGFKKPAKSFYRYSPHKMTIHKKKKSKTTNNGSKKHKNKVIKHVFDDWKKVVQRAKVQPYFDEALNTTIVFDNVTESSPQINVTTTIMSSTFQPEYLNNTTTTTSTTEILNKDKIIPNNETKTEENFLVTVNISNSSDTGTEDTHNSVETDYAKTNINDDPTEKLLKARNKRDVSTPSLPTSQQPTASPSSSSETPPKETSKQVTYNPVEFVKPLSQVTTGTKNHEEDKKSVPTKINTDNKKSDKTILTDSELVYWPVTKNITEYTSNNITTIILEREDKKAKLNMTKEAIRNNRTTALEKAIFGDVNWDDVDTVAPVFLSFVGKYLNGALTFCSQNVCHSMKCSQKTCVHRICHPTDRWNQRGHCAGSNKTDSVASLESIMDLPSNVAFEIVDILQDKMLGKLFGKVTLCINTKCITFVAVKKSFLKSKCSVKDLEIGHCPNIKNVKLV
ncbi:hypothetical protein NE865_10000 [Phthorimaea operculella]|nr:hypothetical protein NE865_10000 [Phthorimaea operculella]